VIGLLNQLIHIKKVVSQFSVLHLDIMLTSKVDLEMKNTTSSN